MGIQYKDSGIEWIGKIPVEWSVCKIKNLCSNIYSGGTPDSNNLLYWDGDIPWIPSGSCHDSIIYEAPKFITQLGYENSSTKLLKRNDSIISARGTVGEMAMIPYPMAFNQSCYGLRAKKGIVDF